MSGVIAMTLTRREKSENEKGFRRFRRAKTPEQSLYGGLCLEMKNSSHPRVRRSAEKGRFELIG